MTSQAEESKHITPEMCAVLRYTAEHGCMAKIGELWLGPARLLERQGLIVLALPRRSLRGAADASRRGGAEHMAVVCGRCGKLGSHRKRTNLEGGSGVNRSRQRK